MKNKMILKSIKLLILKNSSDKICIIRHESEDVRKMNNIEMIFLAYDYFWKKYRKFIVYENDIKSISTGNNIISLSYYSEYIGDKSLY